MRDGLARVEPPTAGEKGDDVGMTFKNRPELLEELLAAVRPILDPDLVSPFISAWEFGHELDGENTHERIAEVVGLLDTLEDRRPMAQRQGEAEHSHGEGTHALPFFMHAHPFDDSGHDHPREEWPEYAKDGG